MNEKNIKEPGFLDKLTQSQRIIVAIIAPILFFFLFIGFLPDLPSLDSHYDTSHTFKMRATWLYWFIFFLIIGVFEIKLFRRK